MIRWSFWAFCLLFLTDCSENKFKPDIVIIHSGSVLYENPGKQSKEIRTLQDGEYLQQLGEVSAFFTPLKIDGKLWEAPWIKVRTRDDVRGWVYAPFARPIDADPEQWLLRLNLQAFIGPELTARHNAWRTSIMDNKNNTGPAPLYRQTLQLGQDMEAHLKSRPEPNDADYQPNLSWLPGLFPGMVFEWPADASAPVPRIDYGYFTRLAFDRKDQQAAHYFTFCISVFPLDSIESAFPVWKMPLSENQSCSKLGAGAHLGCLQAIDSTLRLAPAFKSELLQWKEAIIEDMMSKDAVFWYATEPIRSELDQILSAQITCLQERDKIALQERRRQFEDPEAHGLVTDLRSGRTPLLDKTPN